MTHDMRWSILRSVVVVLVTLGGCRSVGPDEPNLAVCPQTREFANYGCARVIAVLTSASGVPAPGIALAATPLDSTIAGRVGGANSVPSDAQGRAGLQFTWWVAPFTTDPIPMRVVAIRVGSPGTPPQRIDSLDVQVRFAPVGQQPVQDTVRWQLRL
jgi:hypothetical protein